ncbi:MULTISPECIES: hypothetical protein [unclassified Microcoleus]|uniref:hypothetical protein n=2 Tax=unclassified Microcoleus TaxID=2642155 RepID=UPI0025FB0404|nr:MULTISPECIES: hypothetical protein [unclassified Microcoleus]
MPETLKVGDVAPEFYLCEGNDYRNKIPAVDIKNEPISIRDFDKKCLVLIFIGESREDWQVGPRIESLKTLSTFADKCKELGAELVACGMNEYGRMLDCLEKAEVTFRFILASHETPVIHDYNGYSGVAKAVTHVIADGKIQQTWDLQYPKYFDENHFQEVLTYITANNLA